MSDAYKYVLKLKPSDIKDELDISEYKGTDFNNTTANPYDQLYDYLDTKYGKKTFKDRTVSNFCVSEALGEKLHKDLKDWYELFKTAHAYVPKHSLEMLYLDRSTITISFEGHKEIRDDIVYVR